MFLSFLICERDILGQKLFAIRIKEDGDRHSVSIRIPVFVSHPFIISIIFIGRYINQDHHEILLQLPGYSLIRFKKSFQQVTPSASVTTKLKKHLLVVFLGHGQSIGNLREGLGGIIPRSGRIGQLLV